MIEAQDVTHVEIRQAEPVMVYDMAVIINAVYQQNVEPTQAGHVPKRVVNKLRPQVKGMARYSYEGTDDYVDMLFLLLVQMHILQISKPPFSDMKPRVEPGMMMPTWAGLDLNRQMVNLLKTWTEVPSMWDVAGADYDSWHAHWSASSYFYARDTLSGRRALLEQLLNCTPGKWYTVESLLEHIWQEQPLALYQLPKSSQKVELRRARESHDDWMASDGEIYTGMLMSSLAEIGIISLGYKPVDEEAERLLNEEFQKLKAAAGPDEVFVEEDDGPVNPDLFLLTDDGAKLLAAVLNPYSSPAPAQAEAAPALIVQPNFELFLLQPHMPTLYSILPFVQVNQVGTASRLTLTKASILRGIASGRKIEQIIATLTAHSQKELPQNVVYTLQDWARQYKEVRITPAVLVEAPNEKVATQLVSSAKMQAFGVRQLAPTMLVVDGTTNLQELRTALGKEGVTLYVTGNFSTARGPGEPG